jgi:hypothetical protein
MKLLFLFIILLISLNSYSQENYREKILFETKDDINGCSVPDPLIGYTGLILKTDLGLSYYKKHFKKSCNYHDACHKALPSQILSKSIVENNLSLAIKLIESKKNLTRSLKKFTCELANYYPEELDPDLIARISKLKLRCHKYKVSTDLDSHYAYCQIKFLNDMRKECSGKFCRSYAKLFYRVTSKAKNYYFFESVYWTIMDIDARLGSKELQDFINFLPFSTEDEIKSYLKRLDGVLSLCSKEASRDQLIEKMNKYSSIGLSEDKIRDQLTQQCSVLEKIKGKLLSVSIRVCENYDLDCQK